MVIEQADEADRIIQASEALVPHSWDPRQVDQPQHRALGQPVGARAKFGLISTTLQTVHALERAGLPGDLRLLHFHIGSQINDIAVLKDSPGSRPDLCGATRLGARWDISTWAAAWH